MTEEEIAQRLAESGELGSRKPDVTRIASALMPLVRKAQAEALREAASDAVDEAKQMGSSGDSVTDETWLYGVTHVVARLNAHADRIEQNSEGSET